MAIRTAVAIATVLSMFFVPSVGLGGQTYRVIHVGGLDGGGRASAGYGLNDHQQVTGGRADNDPAPNAFVWDDGQRTELSPQENIARSYRLNNDAVIAGLHGFDRTRPEAVLWHRNGTTDVHSDVVDELPGVIVGTWATDINDDGLVAGFDLELFPDATRGYLWRDGVQVVLNGTTEPTAVGVWGLNAHGDVCGQESPPGAPDAPMLWRAESGWLPEVLAGFVPDHDAIALDINDAVEIVGQASPPHVTGSVGFVWAGSSPTFLDRLPGHTQSQASAINNASQVVGESCDSGVFLDRTCVAIQWRDGSLVNLNDRIPNDPEWHLEYATDINERGDITGAGLLAGVAESTAFLAIADLKTTPPDELIAGMPATFSIADAEPATRVRLFAAPQAGTAAVPGCPAGTELDLAEPKLLGSATADASGAAAITIDVPPGAAGRTILFQTASADACMVGSAIQKEIQP